MKVFVIDLARCVGCYCCQIACKDEHVGNDWTPYAKPQPSTGQFWIRVTETVRGTVPKVRVSYMPQLCVHCDDAPCIPVCPIEGAIYKRDDGLVIIDSVKCTGCKRCIDACPYPDLIYFNQEFNIAQKCTGCAHLLDNGWEVPRCVDACATEALKFGEENELNNLISKAEIWHPEFNIKPRVYYLNVPRKFVAGTVYDPVEKEVIIGATCTLMSSKSGKKFTTTTDNFGDFWFNNLEVGAFSLKIEKGRKAKTIDSIKTETDVNLGDIAFP